MLPSLGFSRQIQIGKNKSDAELFIQRRTKPSVITAHKLLLCCYQSWLEGMKIKSQILTLEKQINQHLQLEWAHFMKSSDIAGVKKCALWSAI